jgi:hypothetical protein
MRIAPFLFALPLLGLGLAVQFTAACGSSGLTCQNPTTEEQTCSTCVNTSCANEVSAVESACSAYVSCASACNCGDNSCATGCLKLLDDAGTECKSEGTALITCESMSCKTQCTVTVSG